jgi:hypothetical protein
MTGLISMGYNTAAWSLCLVYNMLILRFYYLKDKLVEDFELDTTVKPKPVLGLNDILLLLPITRLEIHTHSRLKIFHKAVHHSINIFLPDDVADLPFLVSVHNFCYLFRSLKVVP